MGSFAKKIKMNQVILLDKKKIEAGELPKHTKRLSRASGGDPNLTIPPFLLHMSFPRKRG